MSCRWNIRRAIHGITTCPLSSVRVYNENMLESLGRLSIVYRCRTSRRRLVAHITFHVIFNEYEHWILIERRKKKVSLSSATWLSLCFSLFLIHIKHKIFRGWMDRHKRDDRAGESYYSFTSNECEIRTSCNIGCVRSGQALPRNNNNFILPRGSLLHYSCMDLEFN